MSPRVLLSAVLVLLLVGLLLVGDEDGSGTSQQKKIETGVTLHNQFFNPDDPACPRASECGSDDPFEGGGYHHLEFLDRECYTQQRPCVYAMAVAEDAPAYVIRRFRADPCKVIRGRQLRTFRVTKRKTLPKYRKLVQKRGIPTKCVSKGNIAFFNGLSSRGGFPAPESYVPNGVGDDDPGNPNNW